MYGQLFDRLTDLRDLLRGGAGGGADLLRKFSETLGEVTNFLDRYSKGEFAPLSQPGEDARLITLAGEIQLIASERASAPSASVQSADPAALPPWAVPIVADLVGRLVNWLVQRRAGSGVIRSERHIPSGTPTPSPAAAASAGADRRQGEARRRDVGEEG